MTAWGHDVTAAEDGELAWAAFEAASVPAPAGPRAADGSRATGPAGAGGFDVVLTDWEMPNLSGLDLVGRIRAAPAAAFVYVILLTGRADKADLVRGIEAGADDFVTKPFDRDELRVRLLAGERIVRLERSLSARNADLLAAGERIRKDLDAASRVQRAMLPHSQVATRHARTAWAYSPTDELAGDAIGMHLIDDRHLACYVIDVSGHGVPAALLAVTAMHALAPTAAGASPLREASTAESAAGALRRPARVAYDLNRRFSSEANDGRFLTMVLCVLDTHLGRLQYTCAGHPLPLVYRGDRLVTLPEGGGLPLGVFDEAEYSDASVDLEPGDRVCLFSDGMIEEFDREGDEQFGPQRLQDLLGRLRSEPPDRAVALAIEALASWGGRKTFADDVTLVVIDWLGPRQ